MIFKNILNQKSIDVIYATTKFMKLHSIVLLLTLSLSANPENDSTQVLKREEGNQKIVKKNNAQLAQEIDEIVVDIDKKRVSCRDSEVQKQLLNSCAAMIDSPFKTKTSYKRKVEEVLLYGSSCLNSAQKNSKVLRGDIHTSVLNLFEEEVLEKELTATSVDHIASPRIEKVKGLLRKIAGGHSLAEYNYELRSYIKSNFFLNADKSVLSIEVYKDCKTAFLSFPSQKIRAIGNDLKFTNIVAKQDNSKNETAFLIKELCNQTNNIHEYYGCHEKFAVVTKAICKKVTLTLYPLIVVQPDFKEDRAILGYYARFKDVLRSYAYDIQIPIEVTKEEYAAMIAGAKHCVQTLGSKTKFFDITLAVEDHISAHLPRHLMSLKISKIYARQDDMR